MAENTTNHSFRSVLRIGVTGHRDIASDPATAQLVAASLDRILTAVHGTHASCRLLSSLAEGADQMAAEIAVRHGIELQCPLPFSRTVYRSDFSAEGRERFDRLLGTATAVLELGASRDNAGSAYELAGRAMLEHSDLLLAVWDGERSRGRGGTAQIVQEALATGMPVVWINATGGDVAMDFGGGSGFVPFEEHAFLDICRRLVAETAADGRDMGVDLTDAYRAEQAPRWRPTRVLATLWRLTFSLVGGSGPGDAEAAQPHPVADVVQPYEREFTRADRFAGVYTSLYRGSFLANYLLAAIAVSCAIVLLVLEGKAAAHSDAHASHGWGIPIFLACEFMCVGLVIWITIAANRRRWHERSIDYRHLAEQFRQMLYLAPIGRVTPESRPPVHQAFGDVRSAWMSRYFRGVVRETGLPHLQLDAPTTGALGAWFASQVLRGQAAYHRRTAARMHHFEHRLHVLGMTLFCTTAAAVAIHLALLPVGDLGHTLGWMTIVTALLPTWGAAILAIMNHGEFERVARRSKAMQEYLHGVQDSREPADSAHSDVIAYARTASAVARACMDEVADWRMVFAARPIRPPA